MKNAIKKGRALAGGQIIVRTLASSYIALLYLIFRDVPAQNFTCF